MNTNSELFDLILLNSDCINKEELSLFLSNINKDNHTSRLFKNIYIFTNNNLNEKYTNVNCINKEFSFENFIQLVTSNEFSSNRFFVCANPFNPNKKITINAIYNDAILLEPKELNLDGFELNNLCLINNMFSLHKSFKQNKRKWINLKYSLGQNLKNLELLLFEYPAGFKLSKTPFLLNKKVIDEFIDGLSKFNENNMENPLKLNDFSIDILRYIKLLDGDFKPIKYRKLVRIYEK